MPSSSKAKAWKNRAGENSRVLKARNKKLQRVGRVEPAPQHEIWILAGGLSARMGRDKAQVRIRGKTMITLLREKFPSAKVQRKDAVSRCGPLGGIVTVLRKSKAHSIVFLACDMPSVSVQTIQKLCSISEPVFCKGPNGPGFPFMIPKTAVTIVERQIAAKEFALHKLAAALKAKLISPVDPAELINLNTPAELAAFNEQQRNKE